MTTRTKIHLAPAAGVEFDLRTSIMARLNGAAIGFETISQMPLRTRAFWTIKTDPVMFRESAFRFSASRLAGMIELALEAYDWGTNSAHYFNAFCSYAIYPKLTPPMYERYHRHKRHWYPRPFCIRLNPLYLRRILQHKIRGDPENVAGIEGVNSDYSVE